MTARRVQMLLVGMGFASFLAMNSFSLWGFSFLPQFAFGESAADYWSTPLLLSNIATFFIYFLGSTRFPKAFNRAPFMEAVLLLSAGMIFLLGFFLTDSGVFLVISGILVGVGTTCCFLCWETAFSLSEQPEARKQIILGSILSLLPFGLFFVFGQSVLLFTVSFLVFCNLVLLFFALKFKQSDPTNLPDENATTEVAVHIRTQFWKPLLCIVMIGMISPVLGSVAFPTELAFLENCVIVFSANLLSATILGIAWLGAGKDVTISKTYVILFPVLITAFLLFPFLQEQSRIIILFIGSLGFTLFSIVMMMSCITIAHEKRISLVFVYSLFAGVTYASRLIGQGLGTLVKHSTLSPETQILTSVFVLLYACSLVMFLIVRKNAASKTPTTAEPAAVGVDVLAQSCAQLAQETGLSARQAEVLDLLVHGYDVPSIAKKLFISENTVRTHTKKIYTLLDVHSKQEIIDLVNLAATTRPTKTNEALKNLRQP